MTKQFFELSLKSNMLVGAVSISINIARLNMGGGHQTFYHEQGLRVNHASMHINDDNW